ncbi:MAG: hypothetical protein IJU79_03270 [Desulfovibrionaceae bacterium]|nr:hypothetical protein [Desulfovibrionaceae bacterium]
MFGLRVSSLALTGSSCLLNFQVLSLACTFLQQVQAELRHVSWFFMLCATFGIHYARTHVAGSLHLLTFGLNFFYHIFLW